MCWYRIGDFARLTGVSVRTLHHYDRLGLLKPSERSRSGYRWYDEQDILRLQQILTLRYLGFSLSRISELVLSPDFDLLASIRVQRLVLHDRMAELARIDAALEGLLQRRTDTGQWDWFLAAGASAAVHEGLQAKGDVMNEYYTPDQMAQQFQELGEEIAPQERKRIEEEWQRLLAEVRQNRDLDPASAQARSLLERWDELVHATFRGRDKLAASVGEGYRQGRYEETEGAPLLDDFAFLQRVRNAREVSGG